MTPSLSAPNGTGVWVVGTGGISPSVKPSAMPYGLSCCPAAEANWYRGDRKLADAHELARSRSRREPHHARSAARMDVMACGVEDAVGDMDTVGGVLAEEAIADAGQGVRGRVEGELAKAAEKGSLVCADEEVRCVHRAEVDRDGERHEHPRLQVEPVELVELGEGVADRVIGVGARRLHDAADVRVVDA